MNFHKYKYYTMMYIKLRIYCNLANISMLIINH